MKSNKDGYPFPSDKIETNNDKTDMGWEVYPQGLYDLLMRLHKDYEGIDLIITENGQHITTW